MMNRKFYYNLFYFILTYFAWWSPVKKILHISLKLSGRHASQLLLIKLMKFYQINVKSNFHDLHYRLQLTTDSSNEHAWCSCDLNFDGKTAIDDSFKIKSISNRIIYHLFYFLTLFIHVFEYILDKHRKTV